MKRYKLLKDLPTFKAGDEFYLDGSGLWTADGEIMAYNAKTLEKFPEALEEWFEEIVGGPWRAEHGGRYWFIGSDGYVEPSFDSRWAADCLRYNFGNYFKTIDEAKKAVEKLKAWARLKDKGFKFTSWGMRSGGNCDGNLEGEFMIFGECSDVVSKADLDLLFGGEE